MEAARVAAEMKAALAWQPGTAHMNFARGELGQQQRQHVAVADYSHRKNTKRTPAEVEQRLLRSRRSATQPNRRSGTQRVRNPAQPAEAEQAVRKPLRLGQLSRTALFRVCAELSDEQLSCLTCVRSRFRDFVAEYRIRDDLVAAPTAIR